MLSLEKVRSELRAIQQFNQILVVQAEHHEDELIGFVIRWCREEELIALARALAARN